MHEYESILSQFKFDVHSKDLAHTRYKNSIPNRKLQMYTSWVSNEWGRYKNLETYFDFCKYLQIFDLFGLLQILVFLTPLKGEGG